MTGLLSRLKEAAFGPATSAPEPDPRLLSLLENGTFLAVYKPRSDAEKIAVIAQVARLFDSLETPPTAVHVALLVQTLKSVGLAGARAIFGFAASNVTFARSLKLKALARLMEKQPAGTFTDAELRCLYAGMREQLRTNDRGNNSGFAGSEAAQRFEALLNAVPQPRH
jgi:hypothetical protein